MGKTVMGYWDCAFCDTKGIPGTERNCPNCGSPRDKDVKFYMKEGPVTYLTEEETQKKGKGEDWLCSSCGALNSALVTVCPSCGNIRSADDDGYFESRKKEEEKQRQRELDRQPKSSGGGKGKLIGIVIAAVVIIAIIAGVFGGGSKAKDATLSVTETTWESTVEIEEYQKNSASDWTLPNDAEDVVEKNEIHHYDEVLEGYTTETYESYEVIGSHTEYNYVDNGDGTYDEEPYTVDDYGYVTRTREVPVYEKVPVYQTKYYYNIWQWNTVDTLNESGHDKNPFYATYTLKDKQRDDNKYTVYHVTGKIKKKEKTYEISEDLYMKLDKGKDYDVTIENGVITKVK